MKKSIFIIAFIIATCVSCNRIDVPENNCNVLNIDVRNASNTKAVVDDTILSSGSEIGINVTDQSGVTYDGSNLKNIKYTAIGEGETQKWNTASDVLLSATVANISSYYPYDETVTDFAAIPVEATSDVQKDWMWGTPVSGLDNKNVNATINMNHALAAVRLNIVKGSYPAEGKVTSVVISSNGAGTSAVMNATTGALSNIKGAGYTFKSTNEFMLSESGNIVDFIVIPTSKAAPLSLYVTIDGKEMKVQTADITLLPGNIYECNLSAPNLSILSINKLNVTEWTVEQMGNAELQPYSPVVKIQGTTTNITRIEHEYKNKSVIVKAYPVHEGHEIQQISVKGGNLIQTLDDNGVKTFIISDVTSEVTITFKGTTFNQWARIQHVDGTLYTAEEWIAAETAGTVTDADANGVAVLYTNDYWCPHIIHPQTSSSKYKWSNSYTILVPGVATFLFDYNKKEHYSDVNGKVNTDAILAAIEKGIIADAPAAQYCAGITFANGQQGYLPAIGEMLAWNSNSTEVNACIEAIGGSQISSGLWSSTQTSSNMAYLWNSYEGKDRTYNVRAVTSFSY